MERVGAPAVLKVKGSFSFRNFVCVELFEDPESWIFENFDVPTCVSLLYFGGFVLSVVSVHVLQEEFLQSVV